MHPRRAYRWNTPFGRWIAEVGVQAITTNLARHPELAVCPGAVYQWIKGAASPSYERSKALVELSGGELTIDMIRDHRRVVREIQSANQRQNR